MAGWTSLSYEAWKKYLNTDKDMKEKWHFLTTAWKHISENFKAKLNSLSKREAARRKRDLISKEIFNLLSSQKQKLDFRHGMKKERFDEYPYLRDVIFCYDHSADFVFSDIKRIRWVRSMQEDSIDNYIVPVADKIWALKMAVQTSVKPETSKSDLSYQTMKTETPGESMGWWNKTLESGEWDVKRGAPEQLEGKTNVEDLRVMVDGMEKEAIGKCEVIKSIDLEAKNLCAQLRKLEEGEKRLDHFNEANKIVGRLDELLNKRVETWEDLLKIISWRNECVQKLMNAIAVLNKKPVKYHWQETETMKSINTINRTILEVYNNSLRDYIKEWRERLDSKEPKQLDLDFDY